MQLAVPDELDDKTASQFYVSAQLFSGRCIHRKPLSHQSS
jgi:hypothetical protein